MTVEALNPMAAVSSIPIKPCPSTPSLACAPMAAVTHAAFRTLVYRLCGAANTPDEYYSEMISAGALVSGGQYEKWYVIDEPAPDKMVWQTVGGDIGRLTEAASLLASKKGIGVDINMGCCAPDVLCAGAGAAWLDRGKEEIRRMVRSVRDGVKSVDAFKRVSVKMRLCGKNFQEGWLEDTVKMLCDEGVERIAIHARNGKEKYRAAAHWQDVEAAAREAKSLFPNVSIAVNGDILDAVSMRAAVRMCPSVDCIMVGRQAAVTPWIFAQLRAVLDDKPLPLCIDREQTALDFIALLKQYQPKDFWRTRIKRFFAYYAQGLSFAHYFATLMANYQSIEDGAEKIKEYFRRQPSDKILQLS